LAQLISNLQTAFNMARLVQSPRIYIETKLPEK
jgi:hypothetical protein